jgi:Class III cytochrome C family
VVVSAPAASAAGPIEDALLMGDTRGRFVLFPHLAHQRRLGGEASCSRCHHRNVPLDRATSCARCHRDMYRQTDTFDHARHEAANGGRRSCVVCHTDRSAPRTRTASKACASCHHPTPEDEARVRAAPGGEPGVAPGYEKAMHGLCLGCHREKEKALAAVDRHLSRCTTCHRPELRLGAGAVDIPNAGPTSVTGSGAAPDRAREARALPRGTS